MLATAGAVWGANMAPTAPAVAPADEATALPGVGITGSVGLAPTPSGHAPALGTSPSGPLPLTVDPEELLQWTSRLEPEAPPATGAGREPSVADAAPLPPVTPEHRKRPTRDESVVTLVSPDDLDRIDWEMWGMITLVIVALAILLIMLAAIPRR